MGGNLPAKATMKCRLKYAISSAATFGYSTMMLMGFTAIFAIRQIADGQIANYYDCFLNSRTITMAADLAPNFVQHYY